MPEDLIGQSLDKYELAEVLGEGGTATVYRAHQRDIQRDVAIKVLRLKTTQSDAFVERFKREIRTIAALNHAHILKLFDYGQRDDLIYLVMELMVGGSLHGLLENGPLPLDTISRLLEQIASALDYAHGKGIVHRDLKSLNVLLDEAHNAFLADFGMAKLVNEIVELTQSGAMMGTPTHMSPEQWRGEPVDARTDVYALGVVLYEMLSGRVPFDATTAHSMMHMHLNELPPPIRELRPEVPDSVQSVLDGALDKDRNQRFHSAGELALAFKAALQGERASLHTTIPDNNLPVERAPGSRSSIQPIRRFYVFIAAPADVVNEYKIALQVLEQLNYDSAFQGRARLNPVGWDKPDSASPLMRTMNIDEANQQGLQKPSECDIVVLILWSRMGSPLAPNTVQQEGHPFLSSTEWQYADAIQAARRTDVVIYRRSEEPLIRLRDPQRAEKINDYERVETFIAGLRAAQIIRSAKPPEIIEYTTPDHFREQFGARLKTLVIQRLTDSAQVPLVHGTAEGRVTPLEIWRGSPFPGLRAFTEKDAPIFFGRGREVDGLIERFSTLDCRFLAVIGSSGSGKSSLVWAGLLPRLQNNAISNERMGSKDWLCVAFRPGSASANSDSSVNATDNPFEAFAEALLEMPALKPENAVFYPRHKRELVAELQNHPGSLAEFCKVMLRSQPAWADVLIFIDQFEELFTLTSVQYRAAFIDMVVQAASSPRIRFVITLRADFYHRCVEWPELAELLQRGSYPLSAPKLSALYEMITRPAQRAALTFDPGLVDRILEDTGTDPGALPLMAFALNELYKVCQKDGRVMTFQAYEALGGVQAAIGKTADTLFTTFSRSEPDAEQTLIQVFRELITVDERSTITRRRTRLSRVTETASAARLVEALTRERLLVQSQGEGAASEPFVEVSHEALLSSWPRLVLLIENMQADLLLLRQVQIAAQQWEYSGHDAAYLWPEERLKPVVAMLSRSGRKLEANEIAFIRPELDRLVEELHHPTTAHVRREQIGIRLVEIGDTRPGVGLRDGLPDPVWCAVAGGVVTLLNRRGDPIQQFTVQPFQLARYPVTYAQYRAFLSAPDGYANAEWWQGLTRHQDESGQYRAIINHPADNVSWYDSMGFCRWLTYRLRQANVIAPDNEARLPTEWEWQQAATGGDSARVYPWGTQWDAALANTLESGQRRTTAVGVYPLGAAPTGVEDMSGNVWEWCINTYESPAHSDPLSSMARAVRGGAWDEPQSRVRVISRFSFEPNERFNNVGFRVALAAPLVYESAALS